MSQYNARQFEKDVFVDMPAFEEGDSEVVDLFKYGGADKFSAQAIYDVIAAKTFDSGGAEIDTGTFDTKANTDPGDYIVIYDTAGLAWAIAADVSGTDPEPTGDVWVSIPAAQKAQVDLSNVLIVTAANVATAFQDAFNALVDVPFVANDSTADVVFTQDLYGAVIAPEVHNEDDSGDGSISVVVTDAGVASEVDVPNSTISIPDHGFVTGIVGRLTKTGTLPTPFLVATDYFVIVIDANTIQLAASLEDALDGTFIEIEDQGSDENVSTYTPTALTGASVLFQKSNDGVNWEDIQAATSITTDGSVMLTQANVSYRYFKAFKAFTTGGFALACNVLVIGDAN
jgi:hypothetical protein